MVLFASTIAPPVIRNQTYVGLDPSLIFLQCSTCTPNVLFVRGTLPATGKNHMEMKQKFLSWTICVNRTTPVCSLPKIIPAACSALHRKPAAVSVVVVANSSAKDALYMISGYDTRL